MQYLFVRILKARGLAHNESPYVVLFLLADPALVGDDLAPDLMTVLEIGMGLGVSMRVIWASRRREESVVVVVVVV